MTRVIEWREDPEAPGLMECELTDTGEAEGVEPYAIATRGSLPPDVDRAAVEAELHAEAGEPTKGA